MIPRRLFCFRGIYLVSFGGDWTGLDRLDANLLGHRKELMWACAEIKSYMRHGRIDGSADTAWERRLQYSEFWKGKRRRNESAPCVTL